MVETGEIAQEEMDQALKAPIRLVPPRNVASRAPYFTDFVKAELIEKLKDRLSEEEIPAAGYRVYTTLDVLTNEDAQQAVSRGVDALEKRLKLQGNDRLEGALAAVDQSTGYIRALVGGRNYGQSNFNRILNMKRQVGSTFKPFVYLTALTSRDAHGVPYTPGYPIEDAPWTLVYDQGRQSWAPRNYEREFRGWVTLRTALAHSINTVAAKLGVQVGIDHVIETARALGIESELPQVPALSLGVAELSPVELLKAYAAIANHGQTDELTVIRAITLDDYRTFIAQFTYNPKQVFPAGPIDLLADMLQNVFTEGTAQSAAVMGFERPAAGKTGTTSHHRDSWFAGFTPQLTSVVWVGRDLDRDTEKSRVKLTGAGAALPIWVDFMKHALEGEPPTPFPLSPSLTQVRLDRKTGQRASSDCPEGRVVIERVVLGQEPTGWSCENLWPPSVPQTNL
jgi:membrane peptidoglycan carboxypeptidase